MMRGAILLLAVCMLAGAASSAQQPQQPPQASGTAAISGRVVAADTGKPIRGAILDLSAFEIRLQKRTTTDVDGRFQFTDLPATSYSLTASADRYLRMQFGQQVAGPTGLNNPTRPIDLHDAEQFKTADFSLSRQSAVEGTVIDEFGDPVPNVAVQVSQIQYVGGRKRLVPTTVSGGSGPTAPTDDKGQFRIFGLAPGDYYVSALSGAFADPTAAGGFAVTFYPGTTAAGRAQAVTVAAGRDTKNINFTLTPAAMWRIGGTLLDADGKPIARSTVMLMPGEKSGTSAFMIVRASTGVDGRFLFRNVPPGMYTIQAYGAQVGAGGNLNSSAFGWMTVTVVDRDLDELKVNIPPPRSIRGHITFEGDTSMLPKPGDVRIFPAPMDFESAPIGGGPPPYKVNDDWTFEANAMSGIRAMQISAQRWFVQRIMRAGEDVTDVPLDLREKDVNDLEVVLTTRATTLTGTVTSTDGAAVTDYNVVVFPDDDTKWTLWSRYVSFVRPNQQGMFNIRGLPAGSYLAVVVPVLANGEWQDPAFLNKARADATRFTLSDGESKTLQLKMKRP